VLDGAMLLTRQGEAVDRTWRDIANTFPGVIVDMHVIMPDHLHGILLLGTEPAIPAVHSLPDIVGWFKNRTHTEYRYRVAAGDWPPYRSKLWQQSCHDRIIRNARELEAYRAYVEGNPGRWWERQNV
jgi:REP element-mobilizing transposase RayT